MKKLPHENVFVDKNETKIIHFDSRNYSVAVVCDCDGNRFLSVLRLGSAYPLDQETRALVLERFALSLIAPKGVG